MKKKGNQNILMQKKRHKGRLAGIVIKVVFTCLFTGGINLLYAQVAKVTLNKKNAGIEEILKEICSQTGMSYFLNHEGMPKDAKISVNVKNVPVKTALDRSLHKLPVKWQIKDNVIILIPYQIKENKRNDETDELNQTIRGKVSDRISDAALPGAVIILKDSDPIIGDDADENGFFILENIPVGRHSFMVKLLGYKELIVPEIYVGSGKEIVLNIKLEESVEGLDEVVVKSGLNGYTQNDMSVTSVRSFTVEETERYAGSVGDPARMAASFAGVLATGSQTNDIVIRGNSPGGLLWRLNGLDIPNPNHFGSISSTGGAISMLNNKVLRNSDFFSGAFPAEYGNALSGVFDLKLRNGNSQIREYTAQASFYGLELGLEGPVIKSKRASYLFNYKYSTLAIFDLMGLELGIDGIPKYQDMNYNINVPTKKLGTFTLFGILGKNRITIETKNDTLYDIMHADNHMYFSGLSNNLIINKHSSITTGIGYSQSTEGSDNLQEIFDTKTNQIGYVYNVNNLQINTDYKSKINLKNSLKIGLNVQVMNTELIDTAWISEYDLFIKRLDIIGRIELFQSYIQWKHKINDELSFVAGLNHNWSNRGLEHNMEPRLGLNWKINVKNAINVAYGKHSRLQSPIIYFNRMLTDTLNNLYTEPNANLQLSKANHFILGYNYYFNENMRLKTEMYYQDLYNIPIERTESYFSLINFGSSFSFYDYWLLENGGTGRNLGIELTWEKFLSDNYYFLFTTSLFDSKYKGSDNVLRNTRFNGNVIVNFTGGYEWPLKNQNTFALDAKTTWAGGERKVFIDFPASVAEGKTVFNGDNAYETSFKDYFSFDFRISYKINKKKLSHIISVDIVNVTSRDNHFVQLYDPKTGEVIEGSKSSIIPSFVWRIHF